MALHAYLSALPRIVAHADLMMRDRGFFCAQSQENPLPCTTQDILDAALRDSCSIGQSLSRTFCKTSDEADCVYLAFVDPIFDASKNREVMTSGFQLKGVLDEAPKHCAHTVIICYAKLSPDAKKESLKLRKRATVLHVSALAFPISRHVMIPKHVALTSEEAVRWETVHKLQRKSLPILKFSDAVRVWYGWAKGTIVRIERPAGTIWRCVR